MRPKKTERERERSLPRLDLVVLWHRAREFVVKLLQGGHVRKGRVQQVTSQCLVTNVADVIVADEYAAAEVIDPFHGGDAEALDAPQEVLEGYQIPGGRTRANFACEFEIPLGKAE